MKKIYYFSKSKLQFIEIKNYKGKLAALISAIVVIFSSIIIAGYFVIGSLTHSSMDIFSLESENEYLRTKLTEIKEQYANLNTELDSLVHRNDVLRTAVNLPPISDEERELGTGGSSFDNETDILNYNNLEINKAISFVDDIKRKIEFEKSQYTEISEKLENNKRLFEAIPAIKPCTGTVGAHGFGMRYHPILKVRRMHEGIDIITDVGTPVHSPGKGKVDFVGYRGGYGLAVEIDHGFGYRTIFAHLSRALVRVGQTVERGDVIAKTGNSGLSSGPHLHYEVHHNGIKQNPAKFFFEDMEAFELTAKN